MVKKMPPNHNSVSLTNDDNYSSMTKDTEIETPVSSEVELVGDSVEESMAGGRPSMANHRGNSMTSRVKSARLKKKNFNLAKSFTKAASTTNDMMSDDGGSICSLNSFDDYSGHGVENDDDSDSLMDKDVLPKRWKPRSASQRRNRKSGLFSSFSRKKSVSEAFQENGGDGSALYPADVAGVLRGGNSSDGSINSEGGGSALGLNPGMHHYRQSSTLSSICDTDEELLNDLDIGPDHFLDSKTMLKNLGDSPSPEELSNIAALHAKEYIQECLPADVELMNKIPQFAKADLLVRQHLGKGTFSDAFEVIATIEMGETHTQESLVNDKEDLDKLLKNFSGRAPVAKPAPRAKPSRHRRPSLIAEGGDEEDELDKSEDLDNEIDAMFGSKNVADGLDKSEDLDKEIDAMFGSKNLDGLDKSEDLDKEIDALFGPPSGGATNVIHGDEMELNARRKTIDFGASVCMGTQSRANGLDKSEDLDKLESKPQSLATSSHGGRRLSTRRKNTDLRASICSGTQSRMASKGPVLKSNVTYAMKCLRPQIRSNTEHFMIGVEDLVHETLMLASLDHPNIVKIHGRAREGISNSFRLSDGYFILIDRLQDTLDDRIQRWKKAQVNKRAPPTLTQMKTACTIADAMSYLHTKKIVFRDLKPANVGYDSSGVLKLFDFGFAISLSEAPDSPSISGSNDSGEGEEESHLLYDKCGTPRYMAPEVGLQTGYSLPADVYSFGVLLWEICALKKPFSNIKSADEFNKTIFEKGAREKLGKYWPEDLKEIIASCWSSSPMERPEMSFVKSKLAAHVRVLSQQNGGADVLRKSSVFRRFTG
ncbi:hypothetical protein ACHAXR_008979 [Thalassiosira sp. AJA248-18]